MEPASELRTIEVRRVSCVIGMLSEQWNMIWKDISVNPVLIRVVPPKPFGPFLQGWRAFFYVIGSYSAMSLS